MSGSALRPVVGATYRMGEADYRYGRGVLVVQVTAVLAPADYGDELWWQVEAMCADPYLVGPARPRTLYLRASALMPLPPHP